MKFRILEKEKYQDNKDLNIIYKNRYYNIEIDNDAYYLNQVNRCSKKEKLTANELNEVFSLYFLARLESK